jgi:hypothetical protein
VTELPLHRVAQLILDFPKSDSTKSLQILGSGRCGGCAGGIGDSVTGRQDAGGVTAHGWLWWARDMITACIFIESGEAAQGRSCSHGPKNSSSKWRTGKLSSARTHRIKPNLPTGRIKGTSAHGSDGASETAI